MLVGAVHTRFDKRLWQGTATLDAASRMIRSCASIGTSLSNLQPTALHSLLPSDAMWEAFLDFAVVCLVCEVQVPVG